MTQFRADEGLAFMLQYENVAWYDAGEVRILDRRIYPAKIEFVRCKTHVEVMQAIRDMVTQSAGPYTAAAMGMALAAYECREKPAEEQLRFLQAADETISNARPTTYKRMKLVCDGCLEAAKLAARGSGGGGTKDTAYQVQAPKVDPSKYYTKPSANRVNVPNYGKVSYEDAETLEKKGFIKLLGVNKKGEPVFAPTTKKTYRDPVRLTR